MRQKTTMAAEQAAAFNELVKQWQRETALSSVMAVKVNHPAYRQIIEMGEGILPLIFKEMEANGGHWAFALEAITGTNPVVNPAPENALGKAGERRKVRLQWGREHGYLR